MWAELNRNISPHMPVCCNSDNSKAHIPKKRSNSTLRQRDEKRFPYTIINANHMQYGSLISLHHWSHDLCIAYKITSMIQFECTISKNTFQLIVKGNVPPTCKWASIFNTWYLSSCNALWQNHIKPTQKTQNLHCLPDLKISFTSNMHTSPIYPNNFTKNTLSSAYLCCLYFTLLDQRLND